MFWVTFATVYAIYALYLGWEFVKHKRGSKAHDEAFRQEMETLKGRIK